MLGQGSENSVHSTTCLLKATLSRLGDGQGNGRGGRSTTGSPRCPPDAAGRGQHAGLFSLGSSQRVQGSWQGGDHSILGMVTRGHTFFFFFFFDALGMSAFGWALHTHTGTIPGPQCLVPGLFLVLRGEEGKASVQRIREGSVELMSQASPGSPDSPAPPPGRGPKSLLGSPFLPGK